MDDSDMRETVARTLADDSAAAFMARHAGFGYFRGSETPADGLRRTAVDLATAERWSEDRGYVVRWEDDPDADPYCACGEDHGPWYGAGMVDPDSGDVLASLWGISLADESAGEDPYRRVVGAELAAEAMGTFVT